MSTRHHFTDSTVRQLQPSNFEKAQAAIWSLVIVFATLNFVAILMWLQLAQDKPSDPTRSISSFPVPMLDEAGLDLPDGFEHEVRNPGHEELYEIDTPQLAQALEAVTDALSSIRAMLGKIDGDADLMGPGDGRPLSPGFTIVPKKTPSSRWSIEYEPESFDEYLDQLTAFGIEIGFVDPELDRVEILTDLKTKPQIHLTTKAQERRVSFLHSNSTLRRWDLRLAQDAGIEPDGKVMVQFYPSATTARLEELERAEAVVRGVELPEIQRTSFKVRATAAGYEYYVVDIASK